MKITDKLKKRTYSAIDDFGMIKPKDKVVIAVSGGKDSLALLDILSDLTKFSSLEFTLIPVYVVPQVPNIKLFKDEIEQIFRNYGHKYVIQESTHTQGSKLPEGIQKAQTCQWCSYARRITLLKVAEKLGANKIAFGHHMDDIITTLFMNIYLGRRLDLMPPVNRFERGDIFVIRPLLYVREEQIILYCKRKGITPLKANCPLDKIGERFDMKNMLLDIEKKYPTFIDRMLSAYLKKFKEKYIF